VFLGLTENPCEINVREIKFIPRRDAALVSNDDHWTRFFERVK